MNSLMFTLHCVNQVCFLLFKDNFFSTFTCNFFTTAFSVGFQILYIVHRSFHQVLFFKNLKMKPRVSSPFLLDKSNGALSAVGAGGVVLALADQKVGVRVGGRADVCVTVADAATSNTDFFDGIVVLKKKQELISI